VPGSCGLFVGLITLDLIYLVDQLPTPNQKIVALDYAVAAGGPATNAAIVFAYLQNQAVLLGVVGTHLIGQLMGAELQQREISVIDLASERSEPPPTSSIFVQRDTGERSVVSLNAVKAQIAVERLPADVLEGVDIVLIDGHQMAIGAAIARQARAKQIPVVIDGGSWKPGFEQVLPYVDYAICSSQFYPPHCQTAADVITALASYQIPYIAITRGESPILYCSRGQENLMREVGVPKINPVDTVGAGDVFHGAFCHFILQSEFPEALAQAAAIAARSCQSFGTRQWMS
jgi:sugar/nucleoside kinase (ribokinase family)